jgi:5-methylcytosine-specific restriction endonuclease McrA
MKKNTRAYRRFVAFRIMCPVCLAPVGVPCQKKDGNDRLPAHTARYQYAKAVAANPKLQIVSETSFYQSDEWRAVRYLALKAAKGACQCCGARGSKLTPLHVDHIKPRSKFPHLSLDASNLQVLCRDCNLGKSNRDETDWREAYG